MKAVFVLGTLEYDAVREEGEAISTATIDLLEKATNDAGIDASLVFVSMDPLHASRNKRDLTMAAIRAERPRVLSEIAAAEPHFIMCFGPVASACVFNSGQLNEDDLLRRRFFPLGDDQPPVYVSTTAERARYTHALYDWLIEDVQWCAQMSQQPYPPTSTLGEWELILPYSDGWRNMPRELRRAETVGFDLETFPGTNPYDTDARIRMVVLAADGRKAFVVQLPHDSTMPPWLADMLCDPQWKKVGSNIKFDVNWCARFGIGVVNYECTALREHILDPSSPRKDLKFLAFRYAAKLGAYAHAMQERIKQLRNDWSLLTDTEMHAYAAGDGKASIAAYVGQMLHPNHASLESHGANLLRAVYPLLARLERTGIAVNLQEADFLDEKYTAKLTELRTAIYSHLGPINVDSHVQLGNALASAIPGIDLKPKDWRRLLMSSNEDDGDIVSTAKVVLSREAWRHPVIDLVLQYRQYSARYKTFVNGLRIKHLHSLGAGVQGITPSYNIAAETMRLTSSRPNGQNLPRTLEDLDYAIKRQFVSRHRNGTLVDVDLSQIEIRVAAMLSGDQVMIDALNRGGDIHLQMASRMLGKPVAPDGEPVDAPTSEYITKQERQSCKTRTFLILYGGGAHKLSGDLHISKAEAQAMINEYFAVFSGLKRYIDQVHAFVEEHGYVETPFGLRRYFVKPTRWESRDGYSVRRQAFNTMVQLTAALLMYVLMVEVDRAAGYMTPLALQAHDSATYDCDTRRNAVRLANIILETCDNLLDLAELNWGLVLTHRVPIKVDGSFGGNLALDRVPFSPESLSIPATVPRPTFQRLYQQRMPYLDEALAADLTPPLTYERMRESAERGITPYEYRVMNSRVQFSPELDDDEIAARVERARADLAAMAADPDEVLRDTNLQWRVYDDTLPGEEF